MTTPPRCRHCRQLTTRDGNPHYPFCCARCRDIDLNRWFAEDYRLPAPVTERDIDHLLHVMERGEDNEPT